MRAGIKPWNWGGWEPSGLGGWWDVLVSRSARQVVGSATPWVIREGHVWGSCVRVICEGHVLGSCVRVMCEDMFEGHGLVRVLFCSWVVYCIVFACLFVTLTDHSSIYSLHTIQTLHIWIIGLHTFNAIHSHNQLLKHTAWVCLCVFMCVDDWFMSANICRLFLPLYHSPSLTMYSLPLSLYLSSLNRSHSLSLYRSLSMSLWLSSTPSWWRDFSWNIVPYTLQ